MSDTNLEVQPFALKSGWLDATPQNTTLNVTATGLGGTLPTNTTNFCQTGYWGGYPTYWYYPVQDHRPIKLGLSEVEKLRAAAKRDAKLKKILEKFTDQIEVVVDFK